MTNAHAFTFNHFIKGPGNRVACTACEAAAEASGSAYNPLFLHGDVGLGKTHLLHSIAHAVRERRHAHPIYASAERFAIDLTQAIRRQRTSAFRDVYRQADILLLDDVHFLEHKAAIAEELVHTFDALYDRRKQIVVASDRPPNELTGLESRLVSRFLGGMVADIQSPDYDSRLAILQAKAALHGFQCEQGVLEAIARRVTANVRVLEGALVRVAAHGALCGRRLTANQVETLVADDQRSKQPLSLELIKVEVAKHYGLPPTQLEGQARDKATTQVRQIAMYLARELTDSSYPAIGAAFGGRDHSTVMHACRKAEDLMRTELFRAEIEQLTARLRRFQTYGKAAV